MRTFRWVIVSLLFLATTINYIDRQILALVKSTLDHELGWTNQQYGYVNSAFQATYALSYVVFGWVIDRYGIKLGYMVSIVLWSTAAASHGLVGSVRGFLTARFALGAGEGGSFPSCIKAVGTGFRSASAPLRRACSIRARTSTDRGTTRRPLDRRGVWMARGVRPRGRRRLPVARTLGAALLAARREPLPLGGRAHVHPGRAGGGLERGRTGDRLVAPLHLSPHVGLPDHKISD